MSKDNWPSIKDLFRSLDKWRNFAGYPLEPRVDAMIGLFLPTVIEDHFRNKGYEVKLCQQVIPQFPLRKEENNQSYKADFFVLSGCGNRAFLIEIKTDIDSRNSSQDQYLKAASKKSMRCILSDLKKMAGRKNLKKSSRRKYLHILYELGEVGLVKMPGALRNIEWSEGSAWGVFDNIDEIGVCKSLHVKPEIVYIQPNEHCCDKPDVFRYIYFKEVVKSVNDQGKLGKLLACYLQKWELPAGECPPKEA